MYVVRHLAQGEYLYPILLCQNAVQCEIHQMITYGVEQNPVIGRSLVTVVDYVPVKLPALHKSFN